MRKRIKGGDFFSGAGGFTTAFFLAAKELGLEVEDFLAVNCWPRAIATHSRNHPGVRHYCRRLESLRVEEVARGSRMHLLVASPECTHHSNARGGKPMSDQSRSGAWHILDWLSKVYVDAVLIENVKEFRDWGPLGTNGRPLKARKGETYRAFLAALRALGYAVEDRVLNAADYGEAQTRERLFIQAKRRGTIKWPEPTTAGRRLSARDHVIDWSIKGQSIYERKRPLSAKTMARIWEGLQKFGLRAFMTPGNGEHARQKPRTHDVGAPAPTITAQGHMHLVEPFILPKLGRFQHNRPRSVAEPLNTVLTDGRTHLVEPFVVKLRGTNDAADIKKPLPAVCAGGGHLGIAEPFFVEVCHTGKRNPRSVKDPLPTITGANRGEIALCEPALLPQQSGGALRPVSRPAPTIAAGGAVGLVEPYLVEYYGTGGALSVKGPLGTVTTKPRFGLVRPEVIVDGERYALDIRFRMLQPHELAAAQGFPRDYVFTGTKTEQVRQIGNAVPVHLAKALARCALEDFAS